MGIDFILCKLLLNINSPNTIKDISMAGGSVRKRLQEFYKRQQFRLKNKQQLIKIAIKRNNETRGLSLCFATLCVVDLFGVFPIIALPAALISCGYYGVVLLMFVVTIQIYTAVILGRCWIIAEKLSPAIIHKSRYPYAAVAELIYGKYMRIFVTILLDMTVFGGGIPNLLVAAQNMQLLGHRISNGHFYFSFCYWLILIGLFMCPIMWLGSPKNMKALASVSVVTCSIVAILIWTSILTDTASVPQEPFNGIKLSFPAIENLLKAYGMIAFQFDIHPMLLTIEVDMQDKHRIGNAVSNGIFITCFMSVTTTFVAAYRYGNSVTPNVLELLPRSNMLYFAIMLVTLQLCLSSAVGSSALFQHIEDTLRISRKFNLKRCLVRSLLVGFAVVIGELVPRFDLVMGVIGGTLTGPLIFILPPLFYSKISRMEAKYDNEVLHTSRLLQPRLDDDTENDDGLVNGYGTFDRTSNVNKTSCIRLYYDRLLYVFKILYSDCVLSIAVVIFGLAATFASTYFNVVHVTHVKELWSPCIHNISYSFMGL